MRNLSTYYTEGNTIFCHAGIDEEAGEDWQWGTSDEIFVGKYSSKARILSRYGPKRFQ